MAKKKKQKVIYYDDNSTISDMSNVKPKSKAALQTPKKQSNFKDKWKTYWSAVRMMFVPMCVVLTIIAVLFLLLTLL